MRRTVLLLAVLTAGCAPVVTSAPPVTAPTAPAAQPEVIPQAAAQTPAPASGQPEQPPRMRVYYMVLLRRGPAWTAERTAESEAIGRGHMDHIRTMAAQGHLLVAGPFLDQSKPDDYAGVFIFGVDSRERAVELASADPAVQAGRFVPEVLTWMAAEGLRTDWSETASPGSHSPQPAQSQPCGRQDCAHKQP